MNDIDTHTSEYQELRTKLFNLKMRMSIEGKTLTDAESKALLAEIKQAKKDLAHYAFLMQTKNEKDNGGIKK